MRKIQEPIYLFTLSILAIIAGIVTCAYSNRQADLDQITGLDQEVTTYEEPLPVDPYPVTQHVDRDFSYDEVILIGRLRKGILRIQNTEEGLQWYECGERYDAPISEEAATEWAYVVFRGAKKHAVNPWGIMGTIYNESRFDRCSIGKHPRVDAERRGYITPSKLGLSRKRSEIERYLESETWKRSFSRTGMDLGGMQVLSRFIDLPLHQHLTLDPGLLHQIAEMASREAYPGCKGRPWACWRGSHQSWYDEKVTRYARRMGARADEI